MSEIYTVIVGILGILAVSGLFVGVTNDAVNFLNSAIGSKAASMRVILTVASVGILIGVITSSGMMEALMRMFMRAARMAARQSSSPTPTSETAPRRPCSASGASSPATSSQV